jgi:TonB family protein
MTIRIVSLIAALMILASVPAAAFQDGPPYRIGGGVSAPVPTEKAEPEYTNEAREARIEGSVILSIVVDEFGIPTEIQVVRSLDPGLDAKAVEAVEKWRFKPGMRDFKPVAVKATLEVMFKLR